MAEKSILSLPGTLPDGWVEVGSPSAATLPEGWTEYSPSILDQAASEIGSLGKTAYNSGQNLFGNTLDFAGKLLGGNNNLTKSGQQAIYLSKVGQERGDASGLPGQTFSNSGKQISEGDYLGAAVSALGAAANMGASTLPVVAEAMIPGVGMPSLGGAISNEIAQNRAENDQRPSPNFLDYGVAVPTGFSTSYLQGLGVKGLKINPLVGENKIANLITSIGYNSGIEAGTNAERSVAQYLAEHTGTQNPSTWSGALDALKEGAIGGAVIGGPMGAVHSAINKFMPSAEEKGSILSKAINNSTKGYEQKFNPAQSEKPVIQTGVYGFDNLNPVPAEAPAPRAKSSYSSQYFQYLTNKLGVDRVKAAGMVAGGIMPESGGDPGITNNGNAAGLFQWTGDRKVAMIKAVGPDWANNPYGQMQFVLSEPQGQKYLAGNYKNIGEAAKAFTKIFEKPASGQALENEATRRAAKFGPQLGEDVVGKSGAVTTGVDPSMEVSSVAPEETSMTDLIGLPVDYQGITGHLGFDHNGYNVRTHNGEFIPVESGESGAAPSELGITPRPDIKPVTIDDHFQSNDVPENAIGSIEWNPGTNKVSYLGKMYDYLNPNMNKEGNTVSVSLRNANGKVITVRNEHAVTEIEFQKLLWDEAKNGTKLGDITPEQVDRKINEIPDQPAPARNEEVKPVAAATPNESNEIITKRLAEPAASAASEIQQPAAIPEPRAAVAATDNSSISRPVFGDIDSTTTPLTKDEKSIIDKADQEQRDINNTNYRAREKESNDIRNKNRSVFSKWFDSAQDGDIIENEISSFVVKETNSKRFGKGKALYRIDPETGEIISIVISNSGKDALTVGIDPETGREHQNTSEQDYANLIGMDISNGDIAVRRPSSVQKSPIPSIPGKRTDIIAGGKDYGKSNYALVEKSNIIGSHDPVTFNENQNYPQERQNRDYKNPEVKRDAERAIEGITSKGFREILHPGLDSSTGIPVIGRDGIVLSGNNRTFAIQRGYNEYRDALSKTDLSHFGLSGKDLESMKEPVLVRTMDNPEHEAGFVVDSNKSTIKKTTAAEIGRQYKALSPDRQVMARSAISAIYEGYNKSDVAGIDTFLGNMTLSDLPTRARQALEDSGVLSSTDTERNQLTSTGKEKVKRLAAIMLNEEMKVPDMVLDYLSAGKPGNGDLDRKFDKAIGDVFRMRDEKPEKYKQEMQDLGDALIRRVEVLSAPDQYKADTKSLSTEKAIRGASINDEPLNSNAADYYRTLDTPYTNTLEKFVHDKISGQEVLFGKSFRGGKMGAGKSSVFSDDNTPPVGVEEVKEAKDILNKATIALVAPKDFSRNLEIAGHKPLDDFMRWVMPAGRTTEAHEAALDIRAAAAKLAQRSEVAYYQAREMLKTFRKLPPKVGLQFVFDMEEGARQPNEKLQKVADRLHEMLNDRWEQVLATGKMSADSFKENYFPHLFIHPDKAKSYFDAINASRSLEGSKSFTKQRIIPKVKDALMWRVYDSNNRMITSTLDEAKAKEIASKVKGSRVSEPLELVTDNPVKAVLMKVHEMDEFILMHGLAETAKKSYAKYVYAKSKAPEGMVRINGPTFTVYGPPEIKAHEAYDENLMQGLHDFAKSLGVNVERPMRMKGNTWGEAVGDKTVRGQFGGPETVLMHEIGHVIGTRYGLYGDLRDSDSGRKYNRSKIPGEMKALADMRFENQNPSPSFRKYVRKQSEKEANMVHAYIYDPARFKEVAPNVFKSFDRMIDQHPELQGIRELRKSLVLGENEGSIQVPGITEMGHYYAPEPVATVFNNYLSPGLQGKWGYEIFRRPANILNQAQLSFSFFHLLTASFDAMVGKAALGVRKLSTGDFIDAGKDFIKASTIVTPIISNTLEGYKMLKIMRSMDFDKMDPVLKALVEPIILGGGRVTIDSFYKNSASAKFFDALRKVRYGEGSEKLQGASKALFQAYGAILENTAKPMMEWFIPRAKLGAFHDIVKYELSKATADTPNKVLADQFAKAWDSIDNRMGQLVYDNLFWNKSLKDTSMISVRSVGWNLGTERELGGGSVDLATTRSRIKRGGEVMTNRMAYTIALPACTALMGAIMQYLMTGSGPEELKDYFYPKTGNMTPNGSAERVPVFGYAKDVYSLSTHFAETIVHKLNPLPSMLVEMYQNKDFYGTKIKNEDDPWMQRRIDEAKYIGSQFEPFSARSAKQSKDNGGSDARQALSYMGMTTASSAITNSPAVNLMSRYVRDNQPVGGRTSEEADRSAEIRKIKRDIYIGETKGDVSAKERAESAISKMVKEGRLTGNQEDNIRNVSSNHPIANSFSRLRYDQAMRVFELASPAEKNIFLPVLENKLDSAEDQHPDAADKISAWRRKNIE